MPSTVFELRQYTLHPGRRDDLIELFHRRFIEPQQAAGMELLGLFKDASNADRFVWLRGFTDMACRKTALAEFYCGDIWKGHRDAANDTMIDSDNVLLLRAATSSPVQTPSNVSGRIICATYLFPNAAALADFTERFRSELRGTLTAQGVRILYAFETLAAENTFPALPVRDGENAFVLIASCTDPVALSPTSPSEAIELIPTQRSALQTSS